MPSSLDGIGPVRGNVVARASSRWRRRAEVELRSGRAIAVTGESGAGNRVLERSPAFGFAEALSSERVGYGRDGGCRKANLPFSRSSSRRRRLRAAKRGALGSALVDRYVLPWISPAFLRISPSAGLSSSGGGVEAALGPGITRDGTDIVILDEPTAALDLVLRAQALCLIGDLRSRGKCVVFATGRVR